MQRTPLNTPPQTGLLAHIPKLNSPADLIDLTRINKRTFEAYRKHLRYFSEWLTQHHHSHQLPIPSETIKEYLDGLTEQHKATSTVNQGLCGYRMASHHQQLHPRPKPSP